MPFRKIRRGKHRGKYRSPSGRIFTRAQVRRYYARGRSFDADDHVSDSQYQHDAAGRRDPTGTERLRRRARGVLDRRWTVLRGLVRDAIVVRDMFGVERVDADSAQHLVVGGGNRVETFRAWFDSAIDLSVVRGTDWLGGQLHLGYLAGVGHASRTVGKKLTGDAGKPDLLAAASQSELRGVADAVSQRATRAFAESLVTGRSARVTGHAVMRAVSDVGRNRGRVLIDYMTTRAHAEGTLDALQSGGVSRVGLITEHLPAPPAERSVHDARRRGPRSLSRAVQREERRILRLGSPVGVQTAGDDLVCKRCEKIAAEGPYEIDRARGLIPAHPHCRCVFVPADEED